MGDPRKTYRCFMKNPQGRTSGVQEIEATSDAEARTKGLVLLRASVYRAAEVWYLDRLVASITIK